MAASAALEQDKGFKSTNVESVKELITAAKAVACDEKIDRVLDFMDKVGGMEEDVKLKAKRIKELEIELANQAGTHKESHQRALSTYVDSVDELRSRINDSETCVADLRGELEQRDETITTLQENSAKIIDRIQTSDQLPKSLEEDLQSGDVKIQALEQSLRELTAKDEASATALKQRDMQLSQSQVEAQRRQAEYDDLRKEVSKARQQLKDAQNLTVSLNNENLESW